MNIEQLIKTNSERISIKGDNVVEQEKFINGGMKYRIVDEKSGRFKVIGIDGFVMGDGASIKGAVISALACGVPLREINFNGHYVPVKECLKAVR